MASSIAWNFLFFPKRFDTRLAPVTRDEEGKRRTNRGADSGRKFPKPIRGNAGANRQDPAWNKQHGRDRIDANVEDHAPGTEALDPFVKTFQPISDGKEFHRHDRGDHGQARSDPFPGPCLPSTHERPRS